jgi:HEPN domain-containing protein
MPDPSAINTVVHEWVTKAESDLRAAAYLLEPREDRPTDAVCFHAQQCAEKYIKALLVLRAIDFPKTHDIGKLTALLPAALRPHLTPEEQRRLAGYAAAARYPGSSEIASAEARRAVALARRVRRNIRRALPRDTLRRKKR